MRATKAPSPPGGGGSARAITKSFRKATLGRVTLGRTFVGCLLFLQLTGDLFRVDSNPKLAPQHNTWPAGSLVGAVQGSLIIGDSAIEIQELDENGNPVSSTQTGPVTQLPAATQEASSNPEAQFEQSSVLLGTTSGGGDVADGSNLQQIAAAQTGQAQPASQQDIMETVQFGGLGTDQSRRTGSETSRQPSGPLPPLNKQADDMSDERKSRGNGELGDLNPSSFEDKTAMGDVLLGTRQPPGEGNSPDKTITGKVVDFELQPAGGHNKAKIKKKVKKKKKKEESMFKKWGKKKKMEKKAVEKEEKKHMKKKKEEGKKGKKKWGVEEHGQKKKGNYKKKKWGKKVKKGKGVKKGKKGKKFLKDKGHKNTGFKTIYHKEEWGKSSKWHDIKREKKWDEKSKKWKKKWKKEKGKKYKGDHMKKFEKKKKEGKKYKKAKKEKFKKFKKEEFEKGKKKKLEEHKKKKEGGVKKEEKKLEKKKKKKKP